MKLLIADDHSLVRETIAQFLEQAGDFEVHAVADLPQALAYLNSGAEVDLVILDYAMPGMNGLEGLVKALETAAPKPVALMSGVMSRAMVESAIAKGAAGFVPKTLPSRSMVNTIRFMASGETYLPLDFMQQESENENSAYSLSTREKQVLGGICEGKSNKEIAIDLDLQEVTIKLHVKTLSKKLGAKNRTHAAMIARDQNLLG